MSIKVENWEEKKPQISDMHKRMTAKIITYDVKPASLIFFSSFDSMLKSSDTTMSFLPILQRNKQQQQQQETACTGSKLSTKTQHSICFQSLPPAQSVIETFYICTSPDTLCVLTWDMIPLLHLKWNVQLPHPIANLPCVLWAIKGLMLLCYIAYHCRKKHVSRQGLR